MRPFLEKLAPVDGASWAWLDRRLDGGIPFEWHHHPEYELTLTLNSRGQRFVGDHVGSYGDGDLVLVGANLPHTWASTERLDAGLPHRALVMWFHPDWIAALSGLAEFSSAAAMFARAGRGLEFSAATTERLRPEILALFALSASDRLSPMLSILSRLADDRAAVPLSSPVAADPVRTDRGRIDRVLDHIHRNFASRLRLAELADIAALSESGLHRLFARHARTTIGAYVTQLRIGWACAALSATDRPIAHIAAEAGYESLANFNRQFLRRMSMTPRRYRASFRGNREDRS